MDYSLIEILTQEAAEHRGVALYTAVVQTVRRLRMAARVHVYRGIAGAYEGGEFSTINILDLSANLPVKIEILLPSAQLDLLLQHIGELVGDGVVAVRPLDVRYHRSQRRLLPRDLRVMDVMTPNPVTVAPETPVLEIVRILMGRSFRSVPVTGPDRQVRGVVSEEDLIQRAGLPVRPGLLARLGAAVDAGDPELGRAGSLLARDIMTAPVITIHENAPVHTAIQQMSRHQHRTLPVVDAHGCLVGMISRFDIVMAAGHWQHSLEQWNGVGMAIRDPQFVRDALTGQGRHVLPGASLLEIGEVIAQGRVRRVAVVDETGRLVGVVAESDLLRALEPERQGLWDYLVRRLSGAQVQQRHPGLARSARGITAAHLMTRDVVAVRDSEPLGEAVARMVRHGLRELPVVDGDGRFLGFLSRRELMRAMAAGDAGTG